MRATLDRLCPCIAFGFVYFLCDVLVESAYVGVGGIGGAELVTLPDELFGRVCEVGDMVGDVTGGDVSLGSRGEDTAQLGSPPSWQRAAPRGEPPPPPPPGCRSPSLLYGGS